MNAAQQKTYLSPSFHKGAGQVPHKDPLGYPIQMPEDYIKSYVEEPILIGNGSAENPYTVQVVINSQYCEDSKELALKFSDFTKDVCRLMQTELQKDKANIPADSIKRNKFRANDRSSCHYWLDIQLPGSLTPEAAHARAEEISSAIGRAYTKTKELITLPPIPDLASAADQNKDAEGQAMQWRKQVGEMSDMTLLPGEGRKFLAASTALNTPTSSWTEATSSTRSAHAPEQAFNVLLTNDRSARPAAKPFLKR